MWTLFQAEFKRYYRIQWSNPGDSLSWFLYTFLVLAAALVILNGISAGGYGQEERILVVVGWLVWVVASDCMSELPANVSEEAQTGTLEQLCLAPVPLASLLAVRSLAYLIGVGAKGILAVALMGFFLAPLPSGPTLVVIFQISLVGAYGMGYLLAGLALVFKRTEALVGLVVSLMIFLTGALVGLESLGWVYQLLKIVFPLTWGISLMREVISGIAPGDLASMNGLVGLGLHSLGYLSVGLGVFAMGEWLAHRQGTTGHY